MSKTPFSPAQANNLKAVTQLLRQLYGAGRAREALVVAGRALAEPGDHPDYAELLSLAGACALQLRELATAEQCFRRATRCQPAAAEIWGNLAVVLIQAGKLAEAEAALARAIELRPEQLNFRRDRIGLLLMLEHFVEVESACRQLLARSPGQAELHNTLGQALQNQERLAEAEAEFLRATELKPAYGEAWLNLGNLRLHRRAWAEAEPALKQAVALLPAQVDARNNLGNVYIELGQLGKAEACFHQVVTNQPGHGVAWNNLGTVLRKQGRHDEATQALRRDFELQGREVKLWSDLALHLRAQKQIGALIALFKEILTLRPGDKRVISSLNLLQAEIADWSELAQLEAEFLAPPLLQPVPAPYAMLAAAAATPAQQREASRMFAEMLAGAELNLPPMVQRRPEPRARLHIGYIAAEFHNHATFYLLIGVLENHDPERVQVTLYSYGEDKDCPERERLLACGAEFRKLRELGDAEAAAQIAADGVDILIDVKGYNQGHRPGINALRPAPIIVNWLGFPGSFGHPRMADYLIGDAVVSPPEHAADFSETLALMPHSYQPNDNGRVVAPMPARAAVGLPEHAFVFASFNQTYKIRPEIFALWCRILAAVPGSVLWLMEPKYAGGETNLRAAAETHGVAGERLIFAAAVPQAEHLGRLGLADLALDTFPVCSHTTASDALWVGLPIITRPGRSFVSRVAASLLHACGLPQLVVDSDEEVYALAVALAQEPARLAALKKHLVENRLSFPLFDTQRFARDLESLLHTLWEQECRGERQLVQIS